MLRWNVSRCCTALQSVARVTLAPLARAFRRRSRSRRRWRPKRLIMSPVAAAAYLRVSTQQQDWKLQRDAVERAARARGDRIPKGLWFEEKKSGASIDRPALQKLRAAVRAGRVGRVYVFRIDRLTRSGIRDTLALVEEFRRAGAELVTVADGFDMSGPAADVVLAVMAWAAQMERQAIGERVRAAIVRVRSKGGRWGRPPVLAKKTLAKAADLLQRGESVRSVATLLRVPRSTLRDALEGGRKTPSKSGRKNLEESHAKKARAKRIVSRPAA